MVNNQDFSDIKRVDVKRKRYHLPLARFEPRIFGTWGENATTAPQNPKLLMKK